MSAPPPDLTRPTRSGTPGSAMHQLVGCRLDDERPITRIPQVPPFIEEQINLWGVVIPIINLRKR